MAQSDKRAEYRRKWVEALRSGNYKQTDGQLRHGDRFCCLGVLCDLVKEEVGGKWDSDVYVVGDRKSNKSLPKEVEDLIGLVSDDGSFHDHDGSYECLADLNDTGSSFEEIAGLIEASAENLFEEVAL